MSFPVTGLTAGPKPIFLGFTHGDLNTIAIGVLSAALLAGVRTIIKRLGTLAAEREARERAEKERQTGIDAAIGEMKAYRHGVTELTGTVGDIGAQMGELAGAFAQFAAASERRAAQVSDRVIENGPHRIEALEEQVAHIVEQLRHHGALLHQLTAEGT